jgi:hypothetical protein
MIKKLLFIMSTAFVANNIYADTTYVFCATKEKSWEWLKADGKYVSVSGEWKYISGNGGWKYVSGNDGWKYAKINPPNFHYFKIGNDVKVEDLQRQCIQQFGSSYIYAQPADNRSSGWYLFGIDDQNLSYGFYSNCYYQCTINEHIRKKFEL